MPLDPDLVADCPYGPGGLLIDEILHVDKAEGLVRVRMPTDRPLPITETQRTHPTRHPAHVSGGLMVHMTGIVGYMHGYHVMDLRHADGWVGYGIRIHDARFSAMGTLGPPMVLEGKAISVRKFREQLFVRYRFTFTQEDAVIYTSEQSAAWQQIQD